MLRNAIWLVAAFVVAVVLAMVMQTDHGKLAILWPPYRVELSNNMAMLVAFIAFFLVYSGLRAAARVLGAPARLRQYRERRREQRAARSLYGAVLALYEGRYDRSEKLALVAAEHPEASGPARLIAARSAHRLGASHRRDEYIRTVVAARGGSETAALQSQVEFALDDHRPEQAFQVVERLRSRGAEHPVALQTALVAYRESGRWDKVLETVRQLSRRGGLAVEEVQQTRAAAYGAMLAEREGDVTALRELWKSLQADERKQASLAAPTVAALVRANAQDDARRIALSALEGGYNAELVEAYGSIAGVSGRARLEQLERWRTAFGEQPKLLEMLGRVCAAERLWGKAETYLMGSLAAGDSVAGRVALGQLYEATGRKDEASVQYQAGARLAMGERPPLPSAARTAREGSAQRSFEAPRGTAAGAPVVLADTAADVPAVDVDVVPVVAPLAKVVPVVPASGAAAGGSAQADGVAPSPAAADPAQRPDDLDPEVPQRKRA